MKTSIRLTWVIGAMVAAWSTGAARAGEESLVTSVFAKTHGGYQRQKNADGRFARETYVVGQGEYREGEVRNGSIDHVKFAGLVRALAPYLARQNYVPAPDRASADLVLVLHWGTTTPFNDATNRMMINTALEWIKSSGDLFQGMMMMDLVNRMRDQANEKNANLLGYIHEINRRNDVTRLVGLGTAFDDLIQDVEEARYYVVIGAYDMKAVLRGEHRLLWETRVSIRERGNRFDQWLPTMFANASDYFGRESKRLVRQFQRATKVELGELKTLGIVDSDGPAVAEQSTD